MSSNRSFCTRVLYKTSALPITESKSLVMLTLTPLLRRVCNSLCGMWRASGETNSRARKTNTSGTNDTNSNKNKHEEISTTAAVYSLAILGGGAVGKSALTLRYVKNLFIGDYDPTIEDAYRKNALVDGKTVVLDLLDTAGQDNFVTLRSHWMRNKHGLIFVFSLTDENTVAEVIGFLDQCRQIYEEEPQPPTLLVGNKADCTKAERRVSPEEGPRLVETYGLLGYVESSALTGLNVDVVFETVIREAQRRNPKVSNDGDTGKKKIFGIPCTIL